MSLIDILNEQIGQSEPKEETLPAWVNPENGSKKAYDAINELKLEKLSYIKTHYLVADFKAKKRYKITQIEVAKKITMARTGLFTHGSYSNDLNKYLTEVNEVLENEKINRVKPKGLNACSKEEVINKARNYKDGEDYWKNRRLLEFYEDLIAKMPFKDRRILRLT
ncbi:hypothetical protein HG263_19040 [Pseudoalteromonas sp. JBTF-M23]|uniref:Uncharacterized protein n=1 Tax=Pseudoalteromonas caenipelagi TaxID=2726988 RepID=A0A849VJG8_9GAMM|nr:hypothetical protein [Pseudoalteromonas caenipelagi]NOU52603.1 hypothetical protein [Pseudoalteromonas caenipelagi]